MDYNFEDQKQSAPVIKTKKDIMMDLNSTPGWKFEARQESTDKGAAGGKALTPEEKKKLEKGEAERKKRLASEQADFERRISWDTTNDELVNGLRSAEKDVRAIKKGDLESVSVRPRKTQDFVENRIPAARMDGKWASEEKERLKELQKENPEADLCTVREYDSLRELVKSGGTQVFNEKARNIKRELDKLIESVLSFEISLADFNDEYLSEHMDELFKRSLQLKKIASLRDKKEYKDYFDSLPSEKKLKLDIKAECADAFHDALIAHLKVHNVSVTADKAGNIMGVAVAGVLQHGDHQDLVKSQNRQGYESALKLLKTKLNRDEVFLSSRLLTEDSGFSMEDLLKGIEEKASRDQDMYRAFRSEYRTAYGEIKRAASLREKYASELNDIRDRYKDSDEKDELKAGMRVLNYRILMAANHIERYMSFIRFLTGEEKTVSLETREFMEREGQTGLVEAIDSIRTLEDQLDEADGASLYDFVKATKLKSLPKTDEEPKKEEPKKAEPKKEEPKKEEGEPKKEEGEKPAVVTTASQPAEPVAGEDKPAVPKNAAPKNAEPKKEEEEPKKEEVKPTGPVVSEANPVVSDASAQPLEKKEEPKKEAVKPAAASAASQPEEPEEEVPRKIESPKDPEKAFTRQNRDKFWKILTDALKKEEKDLIIPKYYSADFVDATRSKRMHSVLVMKKGKQKTDSEYNEKVPKELIEVFDWLSDYKIYQDQQRNAAGGGLEKQPIPLDLKVSVPYQGYEKQTGLNCWCCAGVAIFRKFLEKQGIALTPEQESKLNQDGFRHNVPTLRTLEETRKNGVPFLDQELYDSWVEEAQKFIDGTEIGNIFEAADYFFNFEAPFRLNKMTFSVQGLKNKLSRDFTEKKIFKEGETREFTVPGTNTGVHYNVTVRKEGTTFVIVNKPEGIDFSVTFKEDTGKKETTFKVSYLEPKKDKVIEDDKTVNSNLQAAFMNQVAAILKTGNLAAVLIETPVKHYLTITGIDGRKIFYLDSMGAVAKDEDVSFFIGLDRVKGEQIELTWFSPLGTPEELVGEFDDLYYSPEKEEFDALLNPQSGMNVYQTQGVCLEKAVTGKGMQSIGYTAYIPRSLKKAPAAPAPAPKTVPAPAPNPAPTPVSKDDKKGEPKKEDKKKEDKKDTPIAAAATATLSDEDEKDDWTMVDKKTLDSLEAEFKKKKTAAPIIEALHKAVGKAGKAKTSVKDVLSLGAGFVKTLLSAEKRGKGLDVGDETIKADKLKGFRERFESRIRTWEMGEAFRKGPSRQEASKIRAKYNGYKFSDGGVGAPGLTVNLYNAMFTEKDRDSLPALIPLNGSEFDQVSGESDVDEAKRICGMMRSLDKLEEDIEALRDSVSAKDEEIKKYRDAVEAYEKRKNLTEKEKKTLANTYKLISELTLKRDIDKLYLEQQEAFRDSAEEAVKTWFEANGLEIKEEVTTKGVFVKLSHRNASSGAVKKARERLPLVLEKYRFLGENLSRLYGEALEKSMISYWEQDPGHEQEMAFRKEEDEKADRVSGIPDMRWKEVDEIQSLITGHPEGYKAHKKEIDKAFAFIVQRFRAVGEVNTSVVGSQSLLSSKMFRGFPGGSIARAQKAIADLAEHRGVYTSAMEFEAEATEDYIRFLITGQKADPLKAEFIERQWKVKA